MVIAIADEMSKFWWKFYVSFARWSKNSVSKCARSIFKHLFYGGIFVITMRSFANFQIFKALSRCIKNHKKSHTRISLIDKIPNDDGGTNVLCKKAKLRRNKIASLTRSCNAQFYLRLVFGVRVWNIVRAWLWLQKPLMIITLILMHMIVLQLLCCVFIAIAAGSC